MNPKAPRSFGSRQSKWPRQNITCRPRGTCPHHSHCEHSHIHQVVRLRGCAQRLAWRQFNSNLQKKALAVNYRPISLTCICCKLFKHVITKHVINHSYLAGNCHGGHQKDALVMDFSKAFEKVGHTRLTNKLQPYGISGRTLTWIHQFLTFRR